MDELSVNELRALLKSKNLSTSGNKKVLLKRLAQNDSEVDELSPNTSKLLNFTSGYEDLERERELIDRERNLIAKERELLELERKLLIEKKEPQRSVLSTKEVIDIIPEFETGNAKSLSSVQWINRIESLKEIYKIDDRLLMLAIPSKLSYTARMWFMTFQDKYYDFENFKNKFLENFKTNISEVEIHDQLRNSIRRKDQDLLEYYYEMIMISDKVDISKEAVIKYIILGINEMNLSNSLRTHKIATFDELKDCIEWYNSMQPVRTKNQLQTSHYTKDSSTKENINSISTANTSTAKVNNNPKRFNQYDSKRCFNCGEIGHFSTQCPKPPRRERCTSCNKVHPKGGPTNCQQDIQKVYLIKHDEFSVDMVIQFPNNTSYEVKAIIDTGSPINIMKRGIVPEGIIIERNDGNQFTGVNNSKIQICGILKLNCKINFNNFNIKFYIVPDETMGYDCLIGREFIRSPMVSCNILTNEGGSSISVCPSEKVEQTLRRNLFDEILNIEYFSDDELELESNHDYRIGPLYDDKAKDYLVQDRFDKLLNDFENRPIKTTPETKYELKIVLNSDKTIHSVPKRLSMHERKLVREMIDDLLDRGIIRPSTSDFASRIVLVKKRNGSQRMCIDYRELNKITIKERFPLPLIDDCIEKLRGKKVFSLIDLRSGFHHIPINEDSVKYTAFVTPDGQYEYLKMPFGLSNAPSVFQRFVVIIFRQLIESGDVIIYIDDILVATDTIEKHFEILTKVFDILYANCLKIQPAKCSFLRDKIDYLGYEIGQDEIRPTSRHLDAIQNYPLPKNVHELHRFIGLTSFFRRFIQNYSILAKPLYDLLKRNADYKFDKVEADAFQLLKSKLISSPTLSLYNPNAATELHTDASQIGFGAILLQRQADGYLHPVLFYSKRTTETEARYHSYELETLAIIYALQRFHVYVHGIHIKLVTDCNSLKLTLEKKDTNNRIMRWALLLENYDYEIVHRGNNRMRHVDALSRAPNILMLECNLSRNLAHFQLTDNAIKIIYDDLNENGENKFYELRENLVYRKYKNRLLFLVPQVFVDEIIRQHHNIGHVGVNKTVEMIRRNYWFTNMVERINEFIKKCMKCLIYEPKAHREGFLHIYDKYDRPFHTIHVDHEGPLEMTRRGYRYIFAVVDGFSKFTKLYPTKTTNTTEVVKHLKSYFNQFSVPLRIVSDRGTCFTSHNFKTFVNEVNAQHVLTATNSPQSNGQVERINRTFKPILSKIVDSDPNKSWDTVLNDTEFVINNTQNRTIGTTPSIALFGVNQIKSNDVLKQFIDSQNKNTSRNLNEIRDSIAKCTRTNQEKNKLYFDKKHIDAHRYEVGDYVFIRNVVNEPGINHKLLPRFKGPYIVTRKLLGERYIVEDVPGQRLSNKPFNGVFAAFNMKPCNWDKQSESIEESGMAEL